MIENPFVLTANIPSEFFCDREKETDKMINYLVNKNNVTLISPRIMGKSVLINLCLKNCTLPKFWKTIQPDFEKLYQYSGKTKRSSLCHSYRR